MKIGLLYDIHNPSPRTKPLPQFYAETLEHMQAMDELGFRSLNMCEHHFQENVTYSTSDLVWNAAAAVKTRRAMIGQAILIVPYAHPVRIAEDCATIDLLSNGRFWLQTGEGYIPREFTAFGIERKHRAGMTAEGMEIIRKCWTEEEFTYEGEHFHLQNVRMRPKPLQRPHPPMFVSAQVPGRQPMERAVSRGFHGTTVGITEGWDEWHAGWVGTIRRQGKDPAQFQSSAIAAVFVTDDPEREWAKHKEGFARTSEWARTQMPVPPGGAFGTGAQAQARAAAQANPFKTPDEAARYLRRCYGKNPPTHLLLWSKRGNLTNADSVESHRMLMDKVVPQLRDLLD